MKVAIIVLNWKQPKLTIDTVNSLLNIKHSSFDFKILLTDNGSPDNSINQFDDKYRNNPYVKILNTNKNLGYSGGNNYAIQYSIKHSYDLTLLINNDVIVDPNFLEIIISYIKKQKITGIFGPKIYFAKGYEYHKDRYKKSELGNVIWSAGGKMDWQNIIGSNIGVDEVDQGQFDQINSNIDFISGCCMLIDNKIINQIGMLDDRYFMYLEDVDFCQRAKLSNFPLIYIPSSKIWHINSGSSKSGGDLHDYFITRNRIIFSFKYASLRTKFAIYREALKTLFFSKSKWKRQAVIDYFLNKTGKGSWL